MGSRTRRRLGLQAFTQGLSIAAATGDRPPRARAANRPHSRRWLRFGDSVRARSLRVSVTGSSEVTSTWKGWAEMADIYKFSDRVVDMGERLADVADAVQGKGNRKGSGGVRWLILPAAGAGLFALGTSGPSLARPRASSIRPRSVRLTSQRIWSAGFSRQPEQQPIRHRLVGAGVRAGARPVLLPLSFTSQHR